MIIRLRGLRAAFFFQHNSYNILTALTADACGGTVIAIALQVRIEEGVLRRDLGAPYLAYQRRVNRWIGRPC